MSNFLIALEVMGLGMLGIFAVILAIIGIICMLTRLSQPPAGTDPDEKDD